MLKGPALISRMSSLGLAGDNLHGNRQTKLTLSFLHDRLSDDMKVSLMQTQRTSKQVLEASNSNG